MKLHIGSVLPRRLVETRKAVMSSVSSRQLVEAATSDPEKVLHGLSCVGEGLTQEEAERRLLDVGPNAVASEQHNGRWRLLGKALLNPLVVLLSVLAAISLATGDIRAAVVMMLMVVLGVVLRFVQEARADTAAAKLRAMIKVTASVLRGGKVTEVPLAELVPGDVVKLAAGDMIPADVRLIGCKDLFVVQASLTGESMPVEKFDAKETGDTRAPLEMRNRTNKIPFIQSRAAWPLTLTSVAIMAFGVWLPFSPLAGVLGFTHLPPLYWPLLALTLGCYVVLTQAVKAWLFRRAWI
jgi:P-type Mg2+ transporter